MLRLSGLLSRYRAAVAGIMLGAAYGLIARGVFTSGRFGDYFAAMTLAFLTLVPLGIGYLAVRPHPGPTPAYRTFVPWLSSVLTVAGAYLAAWEGAICIAMGLPLMLVFSSAGGWLAATQTARSRATTPVILILPWLVMPFESSRPGSQRLIETVSEIEIAAPPSVVWPLIASVDSIRPEERRRALFTTMGFPEPVAATLSHDGVGGVRRATFGRGVVFTEAITVWEPPRRLRFTIDASEVPREALDPHVTIGGPYFDVLTGTYELEELPGERTRLMLRSEHRVSTHFNIYSVWWAHRIMRSIQRHILEVIAARAE